MRTTPWEVHAHPVVPLQTKCHQYWPDPPDIMEHDSFQIRCQSEDCTIAYVFREMLVTNTEVSGALAVGGLGAHSLEAGARPASVALGTTVLVLLCTFTWRAFHGRASTHMHSSTIHDSQWVDIAHVHWW